MLYLVGNTDKMKRTITTITLDPKIKEKAMQLVESKGMKLSSIIELYLRKFIEEAKQNDRRGVKTNSI